MTPTTIRVYTGKTVDLLTPELRDIDIIDIAHHLSLINRYTGATDTGYSVAQHSVLVSNICGSLYSLLHDAHEAYIGDVSHPLKVCLRTYGDAWDMIERKWEYVIRKKFGLIYDPNTSVVDARIRDDEQRCMMGCDYPVRYYEHIEPWGEEEAEERFLKRFHELNVA